MATDEERLLVRIEAQLRQFEKAMGQATGSADKAARKIETRFKKMESTLSGVGKAFGVGLGIGAFVGLLKDLPASIERTVHSAARLVDLADKIGITTDALQELRFQADQNGSSAEALDGALEQFSRRIGLAAAGSGDLLKILQANGIALKDAGGNLRPLNDLLSAYADLIKNAANDQDRAVLATQAFGKAGDEMSNVLRGGSREMEQFKNRAHELGQVVSEDGVRSLESFDDEVGRLRGRWNTAMTEMTVLTLRFLETVGQIEHAIVDPILNAGNATKQVLDPLKAVEAEIATIQGQLDAGLTDPSAVNSDLARLQAIHAELIAIRKDADLGARTPSGVTLNPNRTKDDIVAKPASVPATVIPSFGGSSSRGGRSGSGSSHQQDFAKELEQVRERIALLNAEAAAVGKSTFESEKARTTQELLNQAKRDGLEITPKVRAEIDAEATAYANAAASLEQTQDRFEAINDLAESFGEGLINDIEGLADGTTKLNDILADTAKALRRAALEALLLGKGPLAQLLGLGGVGGGVGGFFGKILGSIGGGASVNAPQLSASTLSSSSQAAQPVVQLQVVPGQMFVPVVTSIAGNVAVKHSQSAEQRAIARGPAIARDQQRRYAVA